MPTPPALASEPSLIEVKVQDVSQLFNSMDPSPFHERDLDHDAEQFIVSWAQEHPTHSPLKLVVHLGHAPSNDSDPVRLIRDSVQHYFAYRAEMTRRDLRLLLREGRWALLVGVTFLVICELIARALPPTQDTWHGTIRQGLMIAGWVAMWRPLEIYLYRWWPVLGLERLYRKLSAMQIEVRVGSSIG